VSQPDSLTVAVPKTLLCWIWGWLVGVLMATGIVLLSIDSHRFSLWGFATFIPPLLSLFAAGVLWSGR
jgi:hypothetical protein